MNHPKVAVAILLYIDGKILMGQRSDNNTWALIGGKVEWKEPLETAIIREVFEESCIEIIPENLQFFTVLDNIYEDKHYVTVCYKCFLHEAYYQDTEEMYNFTLFSLDDLPNRIFYPSKLILDKIR